LIVDDAAKIRVEVELDKGLVDSAADAGVDVSAVANQALQRALDLKRLEQFRKDIQDEIAWYNAHVEKHGLFADEWRRF
jgi:post-segregation antitoxin (ccd killing protein)